jgi:polyferredoxin
MQVTIKLRRFLGALLLTAGLAYPACAAVCPKGIGGCPDPGRCFLFVDADGNSLCDYTGRTGSQSTAGSVPSRPGTSVQATVTPSPDPTVTPATAHTLSAPVTTDTTRTALQNSSTGGFLDTIHVSAPLAEVFLFLVFTGIIFALIRAGVPGIRAMGTLPALALSSLFGLGLSLITTSFLAGSTVAGTVYALVYMTTGTVLVAYLWHTGVMTRRIVLLAAALGTLAGFVFISPIMPLELGGIVNAVTGASALTPGIIVICAVILSALVVGRAFCGSICPVGSLQELAYSVPGKKIVIRHTGIPELVRLVLFIATAGAAIYFIDLMAYTGLYDLFSLTLSAGLVAAAGLLVLSVFLYRPVCRVLCPFGVLFSVCAEFSRLRLHRTGTCTGCRKCEKACPASTAGNHDSKRECYLCGRCTAACPVKTALRYGR